MFLSLCNDESRSREKRNHGHDFSLSRDIKIMTMIFLSYATINPSPERDKLWSCFLSLYEKMNPNLERESHGHVCLSLCNDESKSREKKIMAFSPHATMNPNLKRACHDHGFLSYEKMNSYLEWEKILVMFFSLYETVNPSLKRANHGHVGFFSF